MCVCRFVWLFDELLLCLYFCDCSCPYVALFGARVGMDVEVCLLMCVFDVPCRCQDPHYTGADDLRTVQSKAVTMEGYKATAVGWRSASTFVASSFYNLCLPQTPNVGV